MRFKKLFISFVMIVTIFSSLGTQSYAHSQLFSNDIISVSPLADIIDWRYKIQDGKLYKRLFNYTQEKWIGNWILVS